MAKIIFTYSSQIDPESFAAARLKNLPYLEKLLPDLKNNGLSLVGEEVAWMQGRQWENGKLQPLSCNSVYYRILPDEMHRDTLVAGLFTMAELDMFLHDEGPIVCGTPEQVALEAILNPSHHERRA
jgi:hypothetical protein